MVNTKLKRIYLHPPGGAGIDEHVLREAAVALGEFSVNGEEGRNVGDPVHEWITEGRRKQWEDARRKGAEWAQKGSYSSCGDPIHWVQWMLGCRDESVINRDTDGGTVPWRVGANISRIVASPAYVIARDGMRPKRGDLLHVCNAPGTDHVSILGVLDEARMRLESYDYGQPYGRKTVRMLQRTRAGEGEGVLVVGGRQLRGWVDLSRLELVETAVVPASFELGEEDDNPYPEDAIFLGLDEE